MPQLGTTPRRIERLLTTHRLERVFHGVYRDPATKSTIDQRAMAAALAGGRNAWVSHRMAVDVWQMRSYDAFEHDRIRRNELVLDGWQILNFTKRMLTNKPKMVVDHVERSIAGRPALGKPP